MNNTSTGINLKDFDILTKEFKAQVLITHGAGHHADDVFSTALCVFMSHLSSSSLTYVNNINIDIAGFTMVDHRDFLSGIWDGHFKYGMHPVVIRTTDLDIINEITNKCKKDNIEYIVYDIGRGEFDHHQEDTDVRENGIKYASFGLLWRHFGNVKKFPAFDHFIEKIDDHDNGGEMCIVNRMISDFNPIWVFTNEHERTSANHTDRCFERAVNFAYQYIINFFMQQCSQRDEYIFPLIENEGEILNLEGYNVLFLEKRFIPWRRYAHINNYCSGNTDKKHIHAAIYPSNWGPGYYVYEILSDGLNTMKASRRFDVSISGKDKSLLPEGFAFVHKSGFLANFINAEFAKKGVKYITELEK